jgi:hypothetical protein
MATTFFSGSEFEAFHRELGISIRRGRGHAPRSIRRQARDSVAHNPMASLRDLTRSDRLVNG